MDTKKIKAQLNELLDIVEQIEKGKSSKQWFMINRDNVEYQDRRDFVQIANDYTKRIRANEKRYHQLISEL